MSLRRSTLEPSFLASGQKTDMYVLRHRKPVIEVQEKITEGRLSRLIEFCRDLEPPALTQRHVTALNQISGKKLAAHRQKQSQNGKNPS